MTYEIKKRPGRPKSCVVPHFLTTFWRTAVVQSLYINKLTTNHHLKVCDIQKERNKCSYFAERVKAVRVAPLPFKEQIGELRV